MSDLIEPTIENLSDPYVLQLIEALAKRDDVIDTQKMFLANRDSVIKGLNEMIKQLEGDLEVMRLQRDAKRWTEDKNAGTCE